MIIRVVIVEDNEEVRKLTASLLNMYDGIESIGVFSNAEDFKQALPNLRPHVVLMDIGLPGQSGIKCVEDCHEQYPSIEFVMFTDHSGYKDVYASIQAGANGYVLKGGEPGLLIADIRDVYAGGSPLNRKISRMLINELRQLEVKHPELEKLTSSEWEILHLLDKGLAYKEIAAERKKSEETIRTQIRSIYSKLQVHSRTEALNKLHGR